MKATSAFLILSIAMAAASCAGGRPANPAASAAPSPRTAAAAERAIRGAPAASEYMIGLIKSKKLIFLGELHSTVDPILFLAANLRAFYDAGLRYLFYEGAIPGFAPIGRTDSRYAEPYYIYFTAPWAHAGWKYEGKTLSDAVRELNAGLPFGERLRLIAAENGLDTSGIAEAELLDSRDAYAFETIRAAMDASAEGAKGLVFYGQSHGMKEGAGWAAMGGLLAARYGGDFASVACDYLDDCFPGERWPARIGDDRGTAVAIKRGSPGDFRALGSHIEHFDAFILYLGPKTYGVSYQYVQSKANLVAMFTALRNLEDSSKRDALLAMPVFRSEYLLLIYYLRLYYGDRFGYDLWNPAGRLSDALSHIAPIFMGPGADPVGALELRAPESIDELEEYHRLVYEPMTGRADVDAEKSYEKAVAHFPQDLWASYGLAIALMEKGDYDGALSLFSSLIGRRLSRCMDRLPDIYDRAAKCAEALGMKEKAAAFRGARAGLVNEHGLEPEPWSR
jgi:hypothetical protein